jgi:hypothetical protein
VSAEWFHERVVEALQEAREDKEWQGELRLVLVRPSQQVHDGCVLPLL